MKLPPAVTGFFEKVKRSFRKHPVLFLMSFALAIAATLAQVNLRGTVIGPTMSPSSGGSSSSEDSVRICSDKGTIFEGMTNLDEVVNKFQQQVSQVVAERESFLKHPEEWKCDGTEPAMPYLTALAARLPGWHYPDGPPASAGGQAYKARPVIFESFSSVLAELLREYECKLTRMREQALNAVINNTDLGSSACSPGVDCPDVTMSDLTVRPEAYRSKMDQERHRARVALERTVHVFRSFDANYPGANQMACLIRASHDLKGEVSLIANTTSCMPRIWDALTSIHDKKPTVFP